MFEFLKDIYKGFINSKSTKKVMYISLVVIYIALILLSAIKVNKEVMTPGRPNVNISTNKYVVTHESVLIDTDYYPGNIATVGIYSHKPVSLFQYLIAKLSNHNETEIDYDPDTDLSKSEDILIGEKLKGLSIRNAIIVAYEEAKKVDDSIKLDYEYKGLLVMFVSKDSPLLNYSDSYILPDDYITHINNEKIKSVEHFLEIYNNISDNEEFNLKVLREDDELSRDIRKSDKLGIHVTDWYEPIEETANPKFEIKGDSNSIGSSGGAMLSLAIYNSLIEDDISGGRTIIGTGTINLNFDDEGKYTHATVGKIGGINQKVVTAQLYNADLFIAGINDYDEAFLKAKEIDAEFPVVSVETFSDIIDYLNGDNNE